MHSPVQSKVAKLLDLCFVHLAQRDNSTSNAESYSNSHFVSFLIIFTAFIKKVFAILAVMLIVTGGVMCIFMFV